MKRLTPFNALFCLAFAMAFLVSTPNAEAQKQQAAKSSKADDFSLPDEKKIEYDSENIFGLSEGTDTNSQGEKEIETELTYLTGRRGLDDNGGNGRGSPVSGGRYHVFTPRTGVQYGFTDDFDATFSIFGDYRNVRGIAGLDDRARGAFNGTSIEFKYRFLERNAANPYGFAIAFEPRYARIGDNEGVRQDSFSGETNLLFDARLVPGRLWYAINLGIEPQIGKTLASSRIERQSTVRISNALSLRVLENSFIGAEIRYQRAHNGFIPSAFQGQALFLGPTFYHQLWKGAYISGAWSTQIAGRSHNPPNGTNQLLDLTNFTRHVGRIKVGVNF